jgi:diguanylate cyclase (GGDEF)-like protein
MIAVLRAARSSSLFSLAGHRGRSAQRLVVAALLIAVGLLGSLGFVLAEMRAKDRAYSQESAANLVNVLGSDFENVLRDIDATLAGVVGNLEHHRVADVPSVAREAFVLGGAVAKSHRAIYRVLSSEGVLLYSSSFDKRTTPGDHLALMYHAHTRADIMHVGVPQPDESGAFFLPLSRRFEHNGSLAGVVTAHVPVAYFEQRFRQVTLSEAGLLTLMHNDERVILRLVDGRAQSGQYVGGSPLMTRISRTRDGAVEEYSRIDGKLRIYTHTKLGEYPLRILHGEAATAIDRRFWTEARWVLMIVGVLAAGQLLLIGALAREFSARITAEQKLEAQARIDGLTKVANRLHFEEVLPAEWRRATRTDTPISLLMVDADYFKKYNDYYGHPMGDRLLQMIAEAVMHASRRAGDLAARLGGEEFAILLPGTEFADAMRVAEDLRGRVEALAVDHQDHPLGVATVSIGVATLVPDDTPDGWNELVARADLALYQAKSLGRNRVETFGTGEDLAEALAA